MERSLELGPDDAWVQLWAGRFFLWQAGSNERISEEERIPMLTASREHFERSIDLDPQHPAAYAGLGETYLYAGGDLELGIEALETAQALSGSADDVALPLAQLYIASDRREEARELLEDVLQRSHGGLRAARAQELLREIDADVASEAGAGL